MFYWNYRVVNVQDDPEEEPFYEICEVFYDEEDKPAGWAKANVCGEDEETVINCLKQMANALNHDALEPEDFIGKYYDQEDLH